MDDNELMARLALGHEEALAELIARHRPWAERLARSYLKDDALAEDVVQEAFARVYLLRQSYRPDFTFRTYFTVMVRRLCIDRWRREKHAPALMSDLPEDTAGSAESEALARESRMRLWSMVEALPPADRALLEGYALEGQSYALLAKRTGLSIANVKVRLHRIRKALRHQVWEGDEV